MAIKDRDTWHQVKQGKNKIELGMIEHLLQPLDPDTEYQLTHGERRTLNSAVNDVCSALDKLARLVAGAPPA